MYILTIYSDFSNIKKSNIIFQFLKKNKHFQYEKKHNNNMFFFKLSFV